MSKSRQVRIIFGESHDDPSANLLMAALVPYLPGYKFFDEQPAYVTLEKNIEGQHGLVDSGKSIAEHLGYDERYSSRFEIVKGLSKHRETFAQLLITCQKHHIKYRGIDKEPDGNLSIRDEIMSQAILEEKGPLFCRVGLDHFPGIQQHIFNSIKPEKDAPLIHIIEQLADLNNQYLFIFSTHSLPATTCTSSLFPHLYINLSQESTESAVAHIRAEINKKNAALNPQKPQEEKTITTTSSSIQSPSVLTNTKPEKQKINDKTEGTPVPGTTTTKNISTPTEETTQKTSKKSF